MATVRFTRDTIEKLIKRKADGLYFDETHRGFGLRTYKSGAPATWFVKYDAAGVQRRMTLGIATTGNVDAMRDLAETTRAKAKLGTDTLAEQRAERAKPKPKTLGELVEPYLKDRTPVPGKPVEEFHLRKRSLYISRLYLKGPYWETLHKKPLVAITRKDIVPLIDEMKEKRGAVTADRAKTVLSSLFGWAMDKDYAEANPCADIRNRASSSGRSRVLTEDELAAVWKAADDGSLFGKVVRLLILTGTRKNEICGLLWPEVKLDERLLDLPAERVKTKLPFLICLADQAIAILKTVPAVVDQPRLFGTFSASRYIDDFRAKLPADMPHWTLHDLRRSFSTHANEQGMAPPHVIESALGHLVGNKVSQTYNKALYLSERRRLMDVWGRYVADLVAGRRRKVVPLRKGAA
jgi:integrase